MNSYTRTEIAVGLFVLAGLASVGYLSLSLGDLQIWPADRYPIRARFSSVGGLGEGAPVKLAGVPVGEVESVRLEDYTAEVKLSVRGGLELPRDTIASIRTSGLLGEAYVSLSPGAARENLGAGDYVAQTEPAIDLVEILGEYAFGSRGREDGPGEEPIPEL